VTISTSIPDLYKNLSEKQKSQLPEAFRQALERQSGLK
jgi:hypothetical protein